MLELTGVRCFLVTHTRCTTYKDVRLIDRNARERQPIVWDKLGQNVLVDVNTFGVIGLGPLDVDVQLAIPRRNLIKMIVPKLVVNEVRRKVLKVPIPAKNGGAIIQGVLLFTYELTVV
jgi:hypothetical protein